MEGGVVLFGRFLFSYLTFETEVKGKKFCTKYRQPKFHRSIPRTELGIAGEGAGKPCKRVAL